MSCVNITKGITRDITTKILYELHLAILFDLKPVFQAVKTFFEVLSERIRSFFSLPNSKYEAHSGTSLLFRHVLCLSTSYLWISRWGAHMFWQVLRRCLFFCLITRYLRMILSRITTTGRIKNRHVLPTLNWWEPKNLFVQYEWSILQL